MLQQQIEQYASNTQINRTTLEIEHFNIVAVSIVVSGIQLITKEALTARNITIVSVALGLGFGLGANTAILSALPTNFQLVFGGSGIVPAAIIAIILNIVIPKEKN